MDRRPLLVPPAEAAAMLGIRKTLFYQLASSGDLGPVPLKLSSKKLYRVLELENWVSQNCPPRDQWLAMLEKERSGEGARR